MQMRHFNFQPIKDWIEKVKIKKGLAINQDTRFFNFLKVHKSHITGILLIILFLLFFSQNSLIFPAKSQSIDHKIIVPTSSTAVSGDPKTAVPNPTIRSSNATQDEQIQSILEKIMNTPDEDREAQFAERLYQASLNFIAATPKEANAVAKRIAFNRGAYESVRNACGPLSVAIMKSAGLLPAGASVRDIWLLCARDRSDCNGISTLENEYFPPEEYDYFFTKESIRSYDFVSNPLKPGDWLYLYTTNNGFDHMLVVTRVDEKGAAYTVTNINHGEGFVILEELLYDPTQPGRGLFYELTDTKRLEYSHYLGLSGDGGFLLIRRKGGLASIPILNEFLDPTLSVGVIWNGIIEDANSGEILYESQAYQTFHPASMIKVPIAMLVLDNLENQGKTPDDLQKETYGYRTFATLLSEMIVNSNENATFSLLYYLNSQKTTKDTLMNWGLTHTSLEPRLTTAKDLTRALQGLYSGEFLSKPMRSFLLDLMAIQTENDQTLLGKTTQDLAGAVFYNKRGTIPEPVIVGDMGILEYQGKAYIIVLCGHPDDIIGSNYIKISESIERFSLALADLIREPH